MLGSRTSINRDTKFMCTRDENNEMLISGYFAIFDGRYEMWDNAYEKIAPSAFDETINDDIRALTNHDTTLVLGRTRANTLKLRVDERGLWGEIKVNPADQDAVNLYERVLRGDVSQCSFGFDIIDQSIEEIDGNTVFTLKKVKLYEISVCTFPAYEDTAVSARKKDFETVKNQKNAAWRKKNIDRLKGVNGNGSKSTDV